MAKDFAQLSAKVKESQSAIYDVSHTISRVRIHLIYPLSIVNLHFLDFANI